MLLSPFVINCQSPSEAAFLAAILCIIVLSPLRYCIISPVFSSSALVLFTITTSPIFIAGSMLPVAMATGEMGSKPMKKAVIDTIIRKNIPQRTICQAHIGFSASALDLISSLLSIRLFFSKSFTELQSFWIVIFFLIIIYPNESLFL